MSHVLIIVSNYVVVELENSQFPMHVCTHTYNSGDHACTSSRYTILFTYAYYKTNKSIMIKANYLFDKIIGSCLSKISLTELFNQ